MTFLGSLASQTLYQTATRGKGNMGTYNLFWWNVEDVVIAGENESELTTRGLSGSGSPSSRLACSTSGLQKMAGTESIIHCLGCGADVNKPRDRRSKLSLSKSESGVLSTWISLLERGAVDVNRDSL